jgi:hypothetical protein
MDALCVIDYLVLVLDPAFTMVASCRDGARRWSAVDARTAIGMELCLRQS